MRTSMCFSWLLALFPFASPAVGQEPKKGPAAELADLQGKWRMVSLGTDTKDLPAEKLADLALTLTVKNDGAVLTSKGKVMERYRISVDLKTDPKQIDLLRLDEKGNPRRAVRPKREGGTLEQEELGPMKGLFDLSGNQLRITYGGNENVDRPKAFGDWKTVRSVLGWVLERVKE